ncbi:MAG: hypothetical protein ABI780_06435 [Ardenticatenales bacterium]
MNDGRPDRLGDQPAPTTTLYVLGVGGPIDEEGIGHVERFAWRFLVRVAPGERDAVLGFTSMPRLMAFTRAVNERRPRAVSTEAFKVAAHRFGAAGTSAPTAVVDMAADGFEAWLGRGTLLERIVPELEG